MNVRKWHHFEICIAINDESQGSIAKNLRCDELRYWARGRCRIALKGVTIMKVKLYVVK